MFFRFDEMTLLFILAPYFVDLSDWLSMTDPIEQRQLAPEKAWRATYHQLEIQLEPAQFSTWLRETTFLRYEAGWFVIAVNSPYALQMLEQRLHRNVRRVLRDVCGEAVEVRFQLAEARQESQLSSFREEAAPLMRMLAERKASALADPEVPQGKPLHSRVRRPERIPAPAHELNEEFTFARFLVSRENELLFNAACAVAETPGSVYSPLLVHGGVGLGKTHLLQAIAHEMERRGRRSLYIASEVFTNDLVQAIRKKTTALFRAKYRDTDALLVDDIQFIAGKESTQLEFFHTFNELVNRGKQIVLASDRHPQHMLGIEDRLVSRFRGGLVLDIQPPALETRLAILRMWAQEAQLALTEDVSLHLAEAVAGNIRNLKGLFQKILAHARLQKQAVSMAQVREVAEQPAQASEITPSEIIARVAASYGLCSAELYGTKRSASISRARQVSMYLIREHSALSLPQIGQLLGKRSHTTVLHGCRKIRRMLAEDVELQGRLRQLEVELFGGC